MKVAGFDCDKENPSKCQKHGVSIEEIETVLSASPRVAPDPAHSHDEDRFIAVGQNAGKRILFVAFTFRQKDQNRVIRPISARYMHSKESEAYGEDGS